jgi:hypothetical protein
MKTCTQSIVSCLAVIVLSFAASPAQADHDLDRLLERIDRLAHEIHEHADDLRHEVRHHLVGHPDYGHLLSDVELLHRATVRVEQLVHQPHRLAELCRAAHALDDRVHHLEETLRGCETHVFHSGHGHSGHGHGHVYHSVRRFYFSDSRRLVNAIESDTHQLMRDIERLERRVSTPVYSYSRGVAITPDAIQIGGRGFSFSIGR